MKQIYFLYKEIISKKIIGSINFFSKKIDELINFPLIWDIYV